jgi:L-ornithine N5-oxygenase
VKTNSCSVNEIFDPERVSDIYNASASTREARIALDRNTNYGVVRLSLLEHLYEKQYMQRLREPDESKWRCRIVPNRVVVSASQTEDSGIKLKLASVTDGNHTTECNQEEINVDYIFAATGYVRNSHEEMLESVRNVLLDENRNGKIQTRRDYRVQFGESKVDESKTGIWLQGCNESTHGVSPSIAHSPVLGLRNSKK